MKSLPAGLADHLQGVATTLCRCWRMERRDGVVLGFTDHDRDISFDGVTFEAATGFVASEIEQSLGMNVETQEVSGALRSDRIVPTTCAPTATTARGLISGWSTGWRRANGFSNRFSLSAKSARRTARSGSNCARRRPTWTKPCGRRFLRSCDADLGDARCKVNLANPNHTQAATVTEWPNPDTLVADQLNAFVANWFRGGKVHFDSGANSGLAVEIGERPPCKTAAQSCICGNRCRLPLPRAMPSR